MIIRARPSKTFFYRHFAEDMQQSRGKRWGADIACAQFKHYDLFQTEKLLGVDLRPEVLADFSVRGKQENVHFLISDIRQIPLKDRSLDFLVSTHTLSHIDPEDRLPVLCSFIGALRPDGNLIFNIPCTDRILEREIDEMLTSAFNSVRKIRYRNFISSWYETALSSGDGRFTFKEHGFVARKVLAAASVLLSFLEHIPLLQKTGNMLYYCARGRI
jgi:SAM-dependent methyltransferase